MSFGYLVFVRINRTPHIRGPQPRRYIFIQKKGDILKKGFSLHRCQWIPLRYASFVNKIINLIIIIIYRIPPITKL